MMFYGSSWIVLFSLFGFPALAQTPISPQKNCIQIIDQQILELANSVSFFYSAKERETGGTIVGNALETVVPALITTATGAVVGIGAFHLTVGTLQITPELAKAGAAAAIPIGLGTVFQVTLGSLVSDGSSAVPGVMGTLIGIAFATSSQISYNGIDNAVRPQSSKQVNTINNAQTLGHFVVAGSLGGLISGLYFGVKDFVLKRKINRLYQTRSLLQDVVNGDKAAVLEKLDLDPDLIPWGLAQNFLLEGMTGKFGGRFCESGSSAWKLAKIRSRLIRHLEFKSRPLPRDEEE